MEYVYAAMLIHKAGKKVDEPIMKKVLDSVGVKADEARVKALVASLADLDIDKAISEASIPMAAPVQAGPAKVEVKKEVKEEKADESVAAAGLSALFGWFFIFQYEKS